MKLIIGCSLVIFITFVLQSSQINANPVSNIFDRFKLFFTNNDRLKLNRFVEIDFHNNNSPQNRNHELNDEAKSEEIPERKLVLVQQMPLIQSKNDKFQNEQTSKVVAVRGQRFGMLRASGVNKEVAASQKEDDQAKRFGPLIGKILEDQKVEKADHYYSHEDYDDDDSYEDDHSFDSDSSQESDEYDPYYRDMDATQLEPVEPKTMEQQSVFSFPLHRQNKHDKTVEGRGDLNSGEILYEHHHHSQIYDEDDFKCPQSSDGIYINLHHCKRYYICRSGRKTIVACHHNFSYDSRSRRCLPNSIARC